MLSALGFVIGGLIFPGKFLLMLQSIKRAQRVDQENGELHLSIVKFMSAGELVCFSL